MDLTSIERMLRQAQDDNDPSLFSCVEAVVAGLPPDSRLVVETWADFSSASAHVRRRALLNPLGSARWVARHLRLARTPVAADGDAWGIVIARPDALSYALRIDGTWWARADRGITKVDGTRVVAAWEIG